MRRSASARLRAAVGAIEEFSMSHRSANTQPSLRPSADVPARLETVGQHPCQLGEGRPHEEALALELIQNSVARAHRNHHGIRRAKESACSTPSASPSRRTLAPKCPGGPSRMKARSSTPESSRRRAARSKSARTHALVEARQHQRIDRLEPHRHLQNRRRNGGRELCAAPIHQERMALHDHALAPLHELRDARAISGGDGLRIEEAPGVVDLHVGRRREVLAAPAPPDPQRWEDCHFARACASRDHT